MFDGVAVHGFVFFSHEYKSMPQKGKIQGRIYAKRKRKFCLIFCFFTQLKEH